MAQKDGQVQAGEQYDQADDQLQLVLFPHVDLRLRLVLRGLLRVLSLVDNQAIL